MAKKKTKAQQRAISAKIWETRRKNAEKKKFDSKVSVVPPSMKSADVAPVPYQKENKTDQTIDWSLTEQSYTLPQVKDLGLFAVTKDGQNFRFLRINGQYIQEERHSG